MFRNNYDNDSVTLYAPNFLLVTRTCTDELAALRKEGYSRSNMLQKP